MTKTWIVLSIFLIGCASSLPPPVPLTTCQVPLEETLSHRIDVCNDLFRHLVYIATVSAAGDQLDHMTLTDFNEFKQKVMLHLTATEFGARFGSRCMGLLTLEQIQCEMGAKTLDTVVECEELSQ